MLNLRISLLEIDILIFDISALRKIEILAIL